MIGKLFCTVNMASLNRKKLSKYLPTPGVLQSSLKWRKKLLYSAKKDILLFVFDLSLKEKSSGRHNIKNAMVAGSRAAVRPECPNQWTQPFTKGRQSKMPAICPSQLADWPIPET